MLPQMNIEEMAHQPVDDEETAYTDEDDIDLEDLYSRYALQDIEQTAQRTQEKQTESDEDV